MATTQTIEEQKPVAASAQTIEGASLVAAKVDAYGDLTDQLARRVKSMAPLVEQAKALEAELMQYANDTTDADQKVDLSGETYVLELGTRASKATVNMKKARKQLGEKDFATLATVGVGDLRKYLNPGQLAKVLTEELTGARSKKIKRIA